MLIGVCPIAGGLPASLASNSATRMRIPSASTREALLFRLREKISWAWLVARASSLLMRSPVLSSLGAVDGGVGSCWRAFAGYWTGRPPARPGIRSGKALGADMDALLVCCVVTVLGIAEDVSLSVCSVKRMMSGRRNTKQGICTVVVFITKKRPARHKVVVREGKTQALALPFTYRVSNLLVTYSR